MHIHRYTQPTCTLTQVHTTHMHTHRYTQPTCTLTGAHNPHAHRLEHFRGVVVRAFSREHSQSLTIDQITAAANASSAHQYTSGEVMAALDMMQDANQVMVSEGVVFLI